jgi:hypothetical protein
LLPSGISLGGLGLVIQSWLALQAGLAACAGPATSKGLAQASIRTSSQATRNVLVAFIFPLLFCSSGHGLAERCETRSALAQAVHRQGTMRADDSSGAAQCAALASCRRVLHAMESG